MSVISALFVICFVPEGSGVVLEDLAGANRKRRSTDESTSTQLATGKHAADAAEAAAETPRKQFSDLKEPEAQVELCEQRSMWE